MKESMKRGKDRYESDLKMYYVIKYINVQRGSIYRDYGPISTCNGPQFSVVTEINKPK